jgi:hypothetical protein
MQCTTQSTQHQQPNFTTGSRSVCLCFFLFIKRPFVRVVVVCLAGGLHSTRVFQFHPPSIQATNDPETSKEEKERTKRFLLSLDGRREQQRLVLIDNARVCMYALRFIESIIRKKEPTTNNTSPPHSSSQLSKLRFVFLFFFHSSFYLYFKEKRKMGNKTNGGVVRQIRSSLLPLN